MRAKYLERIEEDGGKERRIHTFQRRSAVSVDQEDGSKFPGRGATMGWRRRRKAAQNNKVSNRERQGHVVYLERGEHLALFLSVDQAVLVLHGDEGSETIGNRVV